MIRYSLDATNSFAASTIDTSSMRCLCIALNILLFKLFDDIVDRNQDLIRRIALNVHSAVADANGTDMYSFKS